MLSHIHNQKSSGSGTVNRIYPENSPERKTHDSLLRSPNGTHKVRAVNGGSSGRKTKRLESATAIFNDEANMIERMESRKILD